MSEFIDTSDTFTAKPTVIMLKGIKNLYFISCEGKRYKPLLAYDGIELRMITGQYSKLEYAFEYNGKAYLFIFTGPPGTDDVSRFYYKID